MIDAKDWNKLVEALALAHKRIDRLEDALNEGLDVQQIHGSPLSYPRMFVRLKYEAGE